MGGVGCGRVDGDAGQAEQAQGRDAGGDQAATSRSGVLRRGPAIATYV